MERCNGCFRSLCPGEQRRGTLRLYLGAAPGVGKTFAMLNEGRRRHERGTDVAIGFVETHGRANTAEQIGELEVIPERARWLLFDTEWFIRAWPSRNDSEPVASDLFEGILE